MRSSFKILLLGAALCFPAGLWAQAPKAPLVQPRPQAVAPAPALMDGQSIETETPEKPDDKPLFPSRPARLIHASAPFKLTTITDKLNVTWALQILPDGKFLVTERLPGALLIIDRNGVISPPLAGVSAVSSTPQYGLLDIALDPQFAANHRIFFTFFDVESQSPGARPTNSNTYVASARLDEAANAVSDVRVILPVHSRLAVAAPGRQDRRAHRLRA